MKVKPFTIPSVENQSFLIQVDNAESFYPYLHRHKEIQICWIKRGMGTLLVQGEVWNFSNGDVFIIASNKAHLFKNEVPGIHMVSLFFDADPESNQMMKIPELKDLSDYFRSLVACSKLDDRLAEECKLSLLLLSSRSKEKGFSVFINLLIKFQGVLEKEISVDLNYSEKDGNRMKTIMNYTLENMNKTITIEDIATEIAYTPEAFCRFFKQRTRKTYIQYLNELRINEACNRILNDKETSISQIGFECGFNNVTHFNRTFKKLKNISPLKYRAKVQSNI